MEISHKALDCYFFITVLEKGKEEENKIFKGLTRKSKQVKCGLVGN